MIYLIKIIIFIILSYNINASENTKNEVIFKINNTFFTNIDLENRTKYISLINNLNQTNFSESQKSEIIEDYISSLIFYEFYNLNNLFYKSLNNEIESIYKKNITNSKKLNSEELKNFNFNIKIDLIRKKIIEQEINLKKNDLLEKANTLDLLYNYQLRNIIIKEDLINNQLFQNLIDKNDFNDLKKYLENEGFDFFYKEEDINNNNIISKRVKKMIDKNLSISINIENGYVNLISIKKDLESFDGIFVELVNFKTNTPYEKEDLQCEKLNKSDNIDKTFYKKYEYSKLNNKIKNNLKSINDYILFEDNNEYNYIILCNLTYDEKLLQNLNFNKNVNSLVDKIQKDFLKKYKNEYKFIKIK